MSNTKLLRCQKCGKTLGYVTVFAKGLTALPQQLQDVKLVAVCIMFPKRAWKIEFTKNYKHQPSN
ncbi:MAG TPA: hypothetical protein VMT26_04230 [Candidatus Bathyarchaeia archaeon]|nr:hypothetical protein [Candidatus Bathyarchaeia archaeon]